MKDCLKFSFMVGFGAELGIFCAKWLSNIAVTKIQNHKSKK